jgi:thioredoxin-dependent peroxiredoxin
MNPFKKLTVSLALIASFTACNAQDITLKEGDAAPDFTLTSDADKQVKLSDFKGKNVVLYFYPKDQTSGCTKEACGMRDNLPQITALNTVVLGVSVDGVESHKEFKTKENLNFILLADTDKKVSSQYSGLNANGMAKRVTFIIDKKGIIKKIFPKVTVDGHAGEILAVLNEIK